jgi:hypothetical protein
VKLVVARFGGVVLVVVAIVVGVLMGRVIESIAVGAVLFAVWTSVRRLLSAPDDEIAGRTRDRAR